MLLARAALRTSCRRGVALSRGVNTAAVDALKDPKPHAAPHSSTAALIAKEQQYVAHNYKPLPVVISRAEGARVWDPEGVEYLDFLSAYSAVNQGHCHPRIVAAATEQLSRCTLTSRAFYNDQLPGWAEKVTSLFGYSGVLPMNSGAEAVETAVKLCRRWGHRVKGLPTDEGVIISACGSFHGRTLAAISMSSDAQSTDLHGPLATGFQLVPYGDVAALRRALGALNGKAVAFIVEPIQGEGGVVVPPQGYLAACHDACREHNALLVADEVQTGLGRTGRLLASEWDGARPDMVIMGKALGGGVFPISAVVADDEVLSTVEPGVHGSTFGGNPLACAVSIAALDVLVDEDLIRRSERLGLLFDELLTPLTAEAADGRKRLVVEQRGRGLLRAIELRIGALESIGTDANQICYELKERGILAKATRESTIRFAPPLTIEESQLRKGASEVVKLVLEYEARCIAALQGASKAEAQLDEPVAPCHRGSACCYHAMG